MTNELRREIDFISGHADDIRPLVDGNSHLRSAIDAATNSADMDPSVVDEILRRFETELFTLKKSDNENGRRVFLTMDNPGAYAGMQGLVKELEKDARCSSIIVMASGIAKNRFSNDGEMEGFAKVDPEKDEGIYSMLLRTVGEKPIDVSFGSVSAANGPENVVMFGGKSNLGAKRSFYLYEAWGGVGNVFSLNPDTIEEIDGIFCNDELAKSIIQHQLPGFSADHIFPTGTPVLTGLEVDKADDYRKIGREKLGIQQDVLAFLYLGDTSTDYQDFNPDLNKKTLQTTLDAVRVFVESNPDKQLAFLFRPHPRDPQKEEMFRILEETQLPPNVVVRRAAYPEVNMNEVAYAADVIASIVSTESFLAARRGREGVFLGYSGDKMSGEVLTKSYGNLLDLIEAAEGISVVSSENDLVRLLETEQLADQRLIDVNNINYAKRIIDIILEEK